MDKKGLTPLQVFLGPGTAFESPGLRLDRDFPDGLAQTLLVVEAREFVPWTKPEDLTYDQKGPLPKLSGVDIQRLVSSVFCRRFRAQAPDRHRQKILRALITRNGGEPVDISKLE